MTAPTRVSALTVRLHDDSRDEFTDVGYYAHRGGLDVVDQDGAYVARYATDQFQMYDAVRPAAPHAG